MIVLTKTNSFHSSWWCKLIENKKSNRMFTTSHNNVHGIWRNNDWIILLNMFKLFPWKWIKRIYLEDNPILVNFDNWIYFQIFRKSCTRSSFWEVSSPWRYICCREKERNVSIQWIFFSEVCFRIWCYL